jgi:NADH:ubiquinone oxidoreductase subunit E
MVCDQKIVITICLGSSCFARGNNIVLQTLQNYIKTNGLEERVKLVGSRCEGQCSKGPNIKFNNELYHDMDAGSAVDLLKDYLSRLESKQE